MKTNTNIGASQQIAPSRIGREARMDAVSGALESQNTQVAQLNESELAEYRAYGAQISQDIDQIQSNCSEMTEGKSQEWEPTAALTVVLDQLHLAIRSGASPDVILAIIQLAVAILEEIVRRAKAEEGAGGADGNEGGSGEVEGGGSGGGGKKPGEVDKPGETKEPGDKDKDNAGMTPVGAARILLQYFDLLDTAAGKGTKDNLFTIADLESVSKNPDAPKELALASAYVLRNPMILNALDVGNKVDAVDGKFGIKDLEKFIEQHEGKEGYDKVEEADKVDGAEKPSETDKPSETEETDKPADADKPSETEETDKSEESADAKSQKRAESDAKALDEAMAGAGTDEQALIDILTSRSNKQIGAIKAAYSKLFGKDLAEAVRSETSGDFRSTLLGLLEGRRDESGKVDKAQAKSDAAEIHDAIDGLGTDEEKLIAIFTSRSKEQLQAAASAYESEYGESLKAAISGDTSGDFRKTLLALLGDKE